MIMKISLLHILFLTVFAICSCTQNELENEEQVKDPEGTISLDISNAKIDNTIYVEDGNFKGALFCPLGEIKGLGYIDKIPKKNWVRTTAVIEGNGYIAWSDGIYYRVFIDRQSGYQIVAKYQYPFEGNIKGIEIEKTELSLSHKAQKMSVPLGGEYLFPFEVSTDVDWCSVEASSSKEGYPYDGISISIKKNEDIQPRECVVVITNTEKIKRELCISQQGAPESVKVEDNKVTLPGTKSSYEVYVSSNSDWNVKSNQSWCTAIKNHNYLTIFADENHTNKMRTAIVSVEIQGNSGAKDYITVTQQPIDFQLSISEIDATGNGLKTSFTINPKIENWSVESTAPWCSVEKSGSQVLVEIGENASAGPRTAMINLFMQGNDIPVSYVMVSQNTMGLDLSVSKIEVDGCSSTSTFLVNTELKQNWSAESSESWCTVTQDGNKGIIYVEENDEGEIREAKVTVRYFELAAVVNVVQNIPTMELSKTEIVCEGYKSHVEIGVVSNVDSWTVLSSQHWCKVTKSEDKIAIEVEDNLSGNERDATISVRMRDGRVFTSVLRQKMPHFSVDKNIVQFEGCASNNSFHVLSDLKSWVVDSSEEWCSVNVDGNKVYVSVADNLSGQEREAAIRVILSDKLYEVVKVYQAKPTFDIVENVNFKKVGETVKIPVSNVSAWSVQCSDDWCTLIHNGTSLTISIGENSTNKIRETDVIVTLLDQTERVRIRQGAYAIGDMYTVYEKTRTGELNEAYAGVIFKTDEYGFHGQAYLLESINNKFFVLYNPGVETIFDIPEGMMSKTNGMTNMEIIMNMPDFSKDRYPSIWDMVYDSDGNEKEFYDMSGNHKLKHRYIPAIDELCVFMHDNLNGEFGPKHNTWIRYLSSTMYTTDYNIRIDGCVVFEDLSLEVSPRHQVPNQGSGAIAVGIGRDTNDSEIITFFSF